VLQSSSNGYLQGKIQIRRMDEGFLPRICGWGLNDIRKNLVGFATHQTHKPPATELLCLSCPSNWEYKVTQFEGFASRKALLQKARYGPMTLWAAKKTGLRRGPFWGNM
jgi:hypothetical protein